MELSLLMVSGLLKITLSIILWTMHLKNGVNNMARTLDKVLDWAVIHGITEKGTVYGQLTKLKEEYDELVEAINEDDADEIADAIGDMQVVLIILSEMLGMSSQDCLDKAYKVISKRTGKMVGGVFVKDSD